MKPLAITMGDAAGIGPEIIAKAYLQEPTLGQRCLVAGDVQAMRRAMSVVAQGDIQSPIVAIETPAECLYVPAGCMPVLQIGQPMRLPAFGQISAASGAFAGECVQWAADAALRGDLAAIVTAPLHKEALALAGPPFSQFPGHTEMLQAFAAQYLGLDVRDLPVRMMLANEEMRTVLVSIHVSLRDAIQAVTFDNVLQTLQITHAALQSVLGYVPRVAVAGLNPHAGEGGRFGREELDIIGPAIAAARDQGIEAHGPFPPDTVFMRARRTPNTVPLYDVVVAMYHDQGLIPVKYFGIDDGVNVTLGLPFVRTSPDHGTAFDIAGTGQAGAGSLRSAIKMAKKTLIS